MSSAEGSAESVGLAFDRAGARRWAKQKIRELTSVLADAKRVERKARKQANKARVRHRRARTTARLSELSVQDLARGSRLRFKLLIDNGIRTAQDVLDGGYHHLLRIDGVADSSARQWMQLATKAAQLQSADLQPPVGLENWGRADFDLVRALQTLASAGSLLGLPHVATVQQLLAALRLFVQATSWLRWLFSSEDKKTDIRSGYPRIRSDVEAAHTGGAFDEMLHAVAEADRMLDTTASDTEVAQGWLNSSAELTALLENLIAEDGAREERALIDARLFSDALSTELAERISQAHLDTRLVSKTLRPYQIFGAKFAVVVGRGLLGDDMGLGKTVQALAAIAHVIGTGGERHHIVICPAALIDNWLREIQETTPSLKGWAFRDRDQGRQAALQVWRAKGGILLTSYDQSEHLVSADLPSLGFVIVDEAHYVKSPKAKRTAWTTQLLNRADRALLMGGTMLENKTEELILPR